MFGRERNTGVSPEDIDAEQQQGDDIKTAAEQLMEAIDYDFTQWGVHPWEASEPSQMQYATAAISAVCDRTSEIFRGVPDVTVAREAERIPADLAHFSLGMARHARSSLEFAQSVTDEQTIVFDEETLRTLAAENNTVFWPQHPRKSAARQESWQDESENPHEVTSEFVRRTIAAAKEINAMADNRLTAMYSATGPDTEHANNGQPVPITVPAHYANIDQLLRGEFIIGAEQRLARLEMLVPEQGEIAKDKLVEAYQTAHDAFVGFFKAYIGACAPNSLGPDFVLRLLQDKYQG
jgi:hypothetical protein